MGVINKEGDEVAKIGKKISLKFKTIINNVLHTHKNESGTNKLSESKLINTMIVAMNSVKVTGRLYSKLYNRQLTAINDAEKILGSKSLNIE